MSKLSTTQEKLVLTPTDNRRLANLCGQFDEHLRQIEQQLNVVIHNRGHVFYVNGDAQAIAKAFIVLEDLYIETAKISHLTPETVHLFIHRSHNQKLMNNHQNPVERHPTKQHKVLKPYNLNQQYYLDNIQQHDISFGIGPAGTGKTYLAVACAVAALEKEQISRILLVRPAVEAGERLGFLPGDFSQKVDPYFRPLYDALYEMLGFEQVGRLIEQHVIEVVPLAYMRGRTLNDAFIILDEAQNTTREQMKMFLTRMGFNSKCVITGDITQTDLPRGVESGLSHALAILKDIKGISFNHFTTADVVRHSLIQKILEAYDHKDNHEK